MIICGDGFKVVSESDLSLAAVVIYWSRFLYDRTNLYV